MKLIDQRLFFSALLCLFMVSTSQAQNTSSDSMGASLKADINEINLDSSSAKKRERVITSGFFGRDNKFWDNVGLLQSSNDLVDDLEEIFESNYRDPSEGILGLSFGYASEAPEFFQGSFDSGMLSVNYDHLAGGEIYNRVSPQLRGYSLWAASFNARVIHEAPEADSGLGFSLGSEVGYGRQRLIDGTISDLLLHDPEVRSSLFYYGVDFSLSWKTMVTPNLRFKWQYSFLPTYFYSAFKDPRYEFRVQSNKIAYRWRSDSDFAVLWRGSIPGEVGVQSIAGPQPLPVHFLPRIWDAIHKVEAFPSLGSAIGLGSFIRFHSKSRKYMLEIVGGFYGGYVGGAANLKLNALFVQAGTFGVEQTPGFQVRESRVNYLSGGLQYAW